MPPLPEASDTIETPPPPAAPSRARHFWLALGLLLVGIGLVGLVVPLLPTTDFLLLALPCLARGSPRVERWVLDHPVLGPPIHAWRNERAITRGSKRAAVLGMSAGLAIFAFTVHPRPLVLIPVSLVMAGAMLWILTRKSPRSPPSAPD